MSQARFQGYHNAVRLTGGPCSGVTQRCERDRCVAGLSDVGWGEKRNVINSCDSGAADLEVYVHSTERECRLHLQDERAGLSPEDIPGAIDGDHWELLTLNARLVGSTNRCWGRDSARVRRCLCDWRKRKRKRKHYGYEYDVLIFHFVFFHCFGLL